MLQQTRVDTVVPYYERWMMRFPTLTHLAQSDIGEVYRVWEGLGYYSRARNLHRTAQMLTIEYRGVFPHTKKDLMRLPGIGAYSAAAIASIVFDQREYVLDGNVRRVLARVFNVEQPLGSAISEKVFAELAARHLPSQAAGDHNQALMELGATVCRPRQPVCCACPVNDICQANIQGLQTLRPVARSKRSIPHHIVVAGVIRQRGSVLVARRPANGLLGGLWEFPGGKQQPGEDFSQALIRELDEELAVRITVGAELGVYRHAYTHFRITLHAFECELVHGSQPQARQHTALAWVALEDLADYAMGKIDRMIANNLTE